MWKRPLVTKLPEIFKKLVGDSNKIKNNLKQSSNKRQNPCKNNATSDQRLENSDEFTTKTRLDPSNASLKNKHAPEQHLISHQNRDAIEENLPIFLELRLCLQPVLLLYPKN